jgi:hypothetical protein
VLVFDEPELELIQTHMTQKQLVWLEVGALAVRKRSECAGVVWAGAGVVVAAPRAVSMSLSAFFLRGA